MGYKEELKKLENSQTYGNVKNYELENGLAERIISDNCYNQNKKWNVEYAKEIMKNKENKNNN